MAGTGEGYVLIITNEEARLYMHAHPRLRLSDYLELTATPHTFRISIESVSASLGLSAALSLYISKLMVLIGGDGRRCADAKLASSVGDNHSLKPQSSEPRLAPKERCDVS